MSYFKKDIDFRENHTCAITYNILHALRQITLKAKNTSKKVCNTGATAV